MFPFPPALQYTECRGGMGQGVWVGGFTVGSAGQWGGGGRGGRRGSARQGREGVGRAGERVEGHRTLVTTGPDVMNMMMPFSLFGVSPQIPHTGWLLTP